MRQTDEADCELRTDEQMNEQPDAPVKPNCYDCKYRGSVPGNKTGILDMFVQTANNAEKLNIKGNPHGVKHGWFMWPVNFDPAWLVNCGGFTPKTKSSIMTEK